MKDLPPLSDDLDFLSPLSAERAERLVSWLAAALSEGGTVVDVGCGWAELLLQVSAAAPLAHAVGVDVDAERIEEAQQRAAARGLESRTTFLTGDGAATGPTGVEALIAIGSSQVWGPDVHENQPLAYGAALAAIRSRVVRGARVVYGDAIWSRSPTPEATAPLSGRDDEFVLLPELVDLAIGHGFAVVAVHEASQDEWDAFESGFTAGCATWLVDHGPDHPDATAVRDRAARQHAAYLGGYRGTLGMAYLQLLAV